MPSGDDFDRGGHDPRRAHGGPSQQQAGDGFDGIFGGRSQAPDGFFGIPDHASGGGPHSHPGAGVELEVLSNSSSNTRNEQLRDRLDHRTTSDISSHGGAQPDRPLISGEPLLQGIGEVPMPLPSAPPMDDGRFLQRRRRQNADGGGDDEEASAAEATGFESYRPPNRNRSLVRPERARQSGVERQRALSRSSGSRRPRAAASAPRNRRKQQQQQAGAVSAPQTRRCCASPWLTYCRVVTFWAPGAVLKCCGMPDPRMQLAWREKIGLVSIILTIMGVIAFLTFGLQQ
ncbi:Chitin synthase, class 3, partial [Coemansia nantahalensis]